jgi:hypothetical protein
MQNGFRISKLRRFLVFREGLQLRIYAINYLLSTRFWRVRRCLKRILIRQVRQASLAIPEQTGPVNIFENLHEYNLHSGLNTAILRSANRLTQLQLLEDRNSRKSKIIVSQPPISNWYEAISEPIIAAALLGRMSASANRIELKCESLRKKNKK